MPRFAVLIHDHPFLHWDFLLEDGSSCRTWRLLSAPDGPGPVSAEPLRDHRLMYLDYEGPVSGDRGTVRSFDSGTFEWVANQPEAVTVRLTGHKIMGIVQLIRNDPAMWSWSLTPGLD